MNREGDKLVGTETRKPSQVMKVFECHDGMLGLDPGPWGANKGLYVGMDTITFVKWLSSFCVKDEWEEAKRRR